MFGGCSDGLGGGVESEEQPVKGGKVELPFAQEENEVLGKEFVELLRNTTREQVDKELTRCPHRETSDKIAEVGSGGAKGEAQARTSLVG